jgi:cytochrome c556
MNTPTSLKRAVFVALALGAASATAVFADTASTTDTTTTNTTTGAPPYGGWHKHHHCRGVLTAAERGELKKDRDSVFAANASLKAQHDSLKQQFETLRSQGSSATQAQWQALHTQKEALQTQMRSAIENVDPGAAAIFTKIDAARAQHHHSD